MKTLLKQASRIGPLILLTICLFGCDGCRTRLEPGGAYAPAVLTVETNATGGIVTNAVALSAPDIELYQADAAFDFAYAAVLATMEFERENRVLLWRVSPNIKHTLDTYRPQVVEVVNQWAVARQAYIANPTPANMSVIQTALSKIRSINASVSAAIPERK